MAVYSSKLWTTTHSPHDECTADRRLCVSPALLEVLNLKQPLPLECCLLIDVHARYPRLFVYVHVYLPYRIYGHIVYKTPSAYNEWAPIINVLPEFIIEYGSNNNTKIASIALPPSTTHPLPWAEQHTHTHISTKMYRVQ